MPTLALHPTVAALSASAALAYAVLACSHQRLSAMHTRVALLAAWILHALVLVLSLFESPARFGFAPALSVIAWLVLTVYVVESRLFPQLHARWALAGMGVVVLVLALVFPGSHYPELRSVWLPLHWALGIASYGLIAAAVVHVWLMQRAEKAMRLGTVPETAMPLLTLERLSFRFVGAGFVLLSATLAAGWYFSEVFADHFVWNHKTVFSVLSWLTIGVLLLGRWRLGWRGRTAAHTLYLAAGLLLLGYVGSRFVLEVLLHRT